jgi:membrane fusion protein, multidrug efflux system
MLHSTMVSFIVRNISDCEDLEDDMWPVSRSVRGQKCSHLILIVATFFSGAFLAGCDASDEEKVAAIRPVRVITVDEEATGDTVSLSGIIEARNEVDLAFRIGGRVINREVNVGDKVTPGQLIARLDSQDEENALRASQAALHAAEGRMLEAERNFERQQHLLNNGHTTRQRYDEAEQVLRTLRSQVAEATAQLAIAENRVNDTALYADAPGEITMRGIEVGQVVQPGQMVVRIARKDGRDAVFDAPPALIGRGQRNAEVSVSLSIDPSVSATGLVREVSPQADPTTGTFRVRVGLNKPPPEMRLGSTVTGRMTLQGSGGISIPSSALSRSNGTPAVWVVDSETQTVSLRFVEVALYRPSEVVLSGGLSPGEVVVTAGVQTLRPGQKVKLLGSQS